LSILPRRIVLRIETIAVSPPPITSDQKELSPAAVST